jgi:DNA (cytosine-5)-methyltransferase 1
VEPASRLQQSQHPLRVLSLFAGIGGFDLGLERTGGFKTVAFCEIDKKAQLVLARHWPGVPIYDDVRQVTKQSLAADGIHPDFICAGFPCQDISYAGKGAGLAGERSGLFYEVARLIGELEPAGVLLENVAALLARGLGDVLGTLASLGYDAEWHCIPASAVGAPHRRDRVWIVAYPNRCLHSRELDCGAHRCPSGGSESGDACQGQTSHGQRLRVEPGAGGEDVPDADSPRLEGWLRKELQERARQRLAWASGASVADASRKLPHGRGTGAEQAGRREPSDGRWWLTEPAVGRVANGVPGRVDSLKQLGNAVVPLLPEIVGGAFLEAIADRSASAPRRETGVARKGESGGAGTAIAQRQPPHPISRTT